MGQVIEGLSILEVQGEGAYECSYVKAWATPGNPASIL